MKIADLIKGIRGLRDEAIDIDRKMLSLQAKKRSVSESPCTAAEAKTTLVGYLRTHRQKYVKGLQGRIHATFIERPDDRPFLSPELFVPTDGQFAEVAVAEQLLVEVIEEAVSGMEWPSNAMTRAQRLHTVEQIEGELRTLEARRKELAEIEKDADIAL